ncbi:MAG: transglycosylase domain-containing protein [Treponema sp.]|jgi:penicillin-binding protein 1C|nr:transglycosylase domain-containing protein [Treponema sp.]
MKRKFSDAARDLFTPLNRLLRLTPFRIAAGAAALFAVVWFVMRFSPYPELRKFLTRPCSVRYYDRNGLLLQIAPLADGLRREKPQAIPPQLKDVFVFSEDRRFYHHAGVDGIALLRAFFQNISGGRNISGASTITMQLARLISDNAQTAKQQAGRGGLGRKIGEAFNALRLETRLSKNEILELYLNSLPFGFSAEGAASAARTFFASELSMLSPAQVFCLAVIPRRPGLYNPLENAETCVKAAAELQTAFSKNKKLKTSWPLLAEINSDDWKYAAASARRFEYPFELPHLIRNINTGLNGGEKSVSPNMNISRGEIHLSVDIALQHYLEGAIAGNVTRYYASRLTNGAAIVIDNDSGEILAWVGSADFYNSQAAGQIDGVLALNQPGSSMKPFLYAMALENGFKPTDVIADIPMNFGESELYIPRNFNGRFNGPILFRAALASSLNIPAVYLLYRLGVQNYVRRLFSLGFDSLEHSAEDAGLGLALGNAPISLLELVRAFSVFPRDGVYIPLTWEPGGTEHKHRITERQIFSADTARLICSFLSDSGARVLAFGSARNFRTPFPSIFKTGTANQYQSIVALGATPKYTAAVWMGNFTGETVIGKTGSSIPAAIARDALIFLQSGPQGAAAGLSGRNSPGFSAPESWQVRQVCALSGMTRNSACLSVISEYLRHGEEGEPCTWHRMINGRSEVIYPAEYQTWFTAAAREGSLDYGSRPLEIISPREGFVYLSSPGIGRDEIPVEVIGGGEYELRITFNSRTFNVRRPFVFSLPRTPGFYTLRVQNGNEEDEVTFKVEP